MSARRRDGGEGPAGRREEPPQEPREGYTALGRILRAHGLAGELRVMSFHPDAPNIHEGREIWAGTTRLVIQSVRRGKDHWIVAFEGIERRETAEEYRGLLLEVPDESIAPEEGAYFVHDLVGLRVRTDAGEEIGVIRDVLQPGANDVYVVDGPGGEVLIPVTHEVVQAIDVAGGEVVITPLPGLLNGSL